MKRNECSVHLLKKEPESRSGKMSDRLKPRDEAGRFLAIFCDDMNCCGALMLDNEFNQPVWRCDGLTHDGRGGPLVACARSYSTTTGRQSSS